MQEAGGLKQNIGRCITEAHGANKGNILSTGSFLRMRSSPVMSGIFPVLFGKRSVTKGVRRLLD